MIGNSSMPGEVSKALAISRERQRRNTTKNCWRKCSWSWIKYKDRGIS